MPARGALDVDADFTPSAGVFPAAGGPDGWAEVQPGADLPVRSLDEVEVFGLSATENSIGFRVDRTGVRSW